MKIRAAAPFGCYLFMCLFAGTLSAQQTPNSDGNYQQLRNVSLHGAGITVDKVTLKRDAAKPQDGLVLQRVRLRHATAGVQVRLHARPRSRWRVRAEHKLTQSGVGPDFRMLVPIYLELVSGQIARLGSARPAGNMTVEQKVPLKGVKEKPRRAMISYYNGVLPTAN